MKGNSKNVLDVFSLKIYFENEILWWWWWWLIFFCGMVDSRKVFSLISSQDHCQRSSLLQISDMPEAGFEPVQNLSLSFIEWSTALV